MEQILHLILTILNLLLIVGCCVVFTNAVEHMGKAYKLNEGAVGSILAAVGTALPETIVPLVAIIGAYLVGSDIEAGKEIGIGAILGAPFLLSTLAMFVTGLAVIIFSKMKLREREMNANYTVMFRDLKFFFVSYTLAIVAAFIPVQPIRYIIAIALFAYYLFYVYRTLNCSHAANCENAELDGLLCSRIFGGCYNIFLIWIQALVSVAALIVFSHFFVEQIKFFAHVFSINPLILSLILAPIATELPEKFNSVLWIKQSKDTLALGNITGAMVFQSCIPTAIGILLTPWVFGMESLVNIGLVYISTFIIFIDLYKDKKFCPRMLLYCGAFYLVYIVYIVSDMIANTTAPIGIGM